MEAKTPDELQTILQGVGYFADKDLATALFVALRLDRPLLVEGEAGVGKTSLATSLADALSAPLMRLQCYEGLDVNQSLYEWNYAKQLLAIRLAESANQSLTSGDIFTIDYLVPRPLLSAILSEEQPVLLIDEVDRSGPDFEALLLELLSEKQVTIPELGTLRARVSPIVVLTSNQTRQISDALRRRCFYYWMDFPSPEKEYQILKDRFPGLSGQLIRQTTEYVQGIRGLALEKPPGVSETLDWVSAVSELQPSQQEETQLAAFLATLSALAKDRGDAQIISEYLVSTSPRNP